MNEKFSKEERLKSRKLIEMLFQKGESFSEYPFRFIYFLPGKERIAGIKIAFSVSKKNFPHAVDRNRIKRQMREIYRRNKIVLNTEKCAPAAVMILYSSNRSVPYGQMKDRLCKGLERLGETLQKSVER